MRSYCLLLIFCWCARKMNHGTDSCKATLQLSRKRTISVVLVIIIPTEQNEHEKQRKRRCGIKEKEETELCLYTRTCVCILVEFAQPFLKCLLQRKSTSAILLFRGPNQCKEHLTTVGVMNEIGQNCSSSLPANSVTQLGHPELYIFYSSLYYVCLQRSHNIIIYNYVIIIQKIIIIFKRLLLIYCW